MPNVLHVVPYFPSDRIGGVGEVVAHVHRALRAAGHQSIVLTTGTSKDDASVYRIARSPTAFCIAAARYASLARDADIVHIHHGEGVALLQAMRTRGIRTPVLLTLHVSVAAMRRALGPYTVDGRTFRRDSLRSWTYRQVVMRIRSQLDRIAMSYADRLSFISTSAAMDVLGSKEGGRANVVYNGVPAARETSTPTTTTELLFVGTNSERKRVELLPLILAHVRRRRPDARLRIIGLAREDNRELVALATEFGVLGAMEFAGRVKPGELGRFYRESRVLLVPSSYEGLPMVILEAMQHGLPVVATRVSGHPEVITDNVSGLLVPLDDPAAMADAALRVLDNASLGERFAAAGWAVVTDRFSIERQVAAYLAEYRSLAAQS